MLLQKGAPWLFFDGGSTLVDESQAYEHRIRTMLNGTQIPYNEFPETSSLVERLSKRFSLGIIANQPRGTEDRLRRFGILDFFSVVVSSAEEGISKPDRRIFEPALNRAGCPPERAVMVGDRIDNDVVPAKALGMQTIWVKQGFSAYAVNPPHQDKADAVIDNIGQVESIVVGRSK